jgi:hypothetical protein
VFGFALVLALLRVGLFTELGGIRFGARWAMLDFDSGAYYPVKAFLSGENPYDRQRFLSLYPVGDGFPPYPPFTLLFHLPFALLPHATAAAAYAAFTVGLMLLLARLALKETQGSATMTGVLLLAGVLLLTRPGHWNLVLGQRAALLTLGSYVALFKARRAPWVSGAGLMLATLKPTWGGPLAVLMLVRGDRAAVGAGAFLTAALNVPLLVVIVHRAGGIKTFLDRVTTGYRQWQGVSDVSPATSSVRIDAATTVSRFLGHPLGDGAQVLLVLLVIATSALAVRALKNERSPEAQDLTTGTICTAVLLCGHHVGYDFLLLTIPAMAVLFHGLPTTTHPYGRRIFLVLFAIPAFNWAATESVLNALQPSPVVWLAIASLNGIVLIAAFCGYLWLAARWSRSSTELLPGGHPVPSHLLLGGTQTRS